MSAFPKADIENMGVGTGLDGRFWPKAVIGSKMSLFVTGRRR